MTSDTTSGGETPSAGAAAFASAQWSLGEQFRAIEGLDSKAERLFGAALVIAGLYGALAAFTADRADSAIGAVLATGLPLALAFTYAAFSFLNGYRISDWGAGPPGVDLLAAAAQYDGTQVQLWLARQFARSHDENLDPLARKARWFRYALVGVAVELEMLLGASTIALVTLGTT